MREGKLVFGTEVVHVEPACLLGAEKIKRKWKIVWRGRPRPRGLGLRGGCGRFEGKSKGRRKARAKAGPRGRGRPRHTGLSQSFQDLVSQLRDVARAEGENHVAIAGKYDGSEGGLIEGTRVLRVGLALLTDPLRQHLTGNPNNWRLTGGLDIQHNYGGSIRKRSRKLFHQQLGPRIAVRLKDHVNPRETSLLGGRQSGADFGGVMPVVVHHRHTTNHSLLLKAPVYAAEGPQGFADVCRRNIEADADRDGCGGVEDVVLPGNVKFEFA